MSRDVAEVEVEDNITLIGLGVATPLPDGTIAERLTVPEKPLDPVIVSVELPEIPELIAKDAGLATMLKSGMGTVTESVVGREVVEFVAVTVMLYKPGEVFAGAEIVKFDFAVPPAGTPTGLMLKLLVMRPIGDEMELDSITEPAKLLRLVTEMVELEFVP